MENAALYASATWHYRDIGLELLATLAHNGQRYTVPMYGGESLCHAIFKVSIAAHLLAWGYNWKQILWEERPSQGPKAYRPDICTQGNDRLPSFWFECRGTETEKLKAITAALPDFRVINVVDSEWFDNFWNGKGVYFYPGDRLVRTKQIKNWKERKRLITEQREAAIPSKIEFWGITGTDAIPRIVYAVRRRDDGRFVYLDSGEGWSLSSFRYVSKRSENFQALIPGIVGSEKWRGESRTLIQHSSSAPT